MKVQLGGVKWTSKLRMKFEQVFFRWGFIIVVIGFLLGRAYILTNILPFCTTVFFFAAVYVMKRDKMPLAFLALMGGALSVSIDNLFFTFASLFTFFIYNIFFSRFTRKTVGLVPFQVFISAINCTFSCRIFAQQTVTMYDLLVSTIEAGLASY